MIKGLPHADGLVVGYLPNERILVYADMFNLPSPANPPTNSTLSWRPSSEPSVGGNAARGPSAFGHQYPIDMPFGT